MSSDSAFRSSELDRSGVQYMLELVPGNNAATTRKFLTDLYTTMKAEAQRQIDAEKSRHALQPSALIHEAFLRLLGQDRTDWQNREHFLAIASRTMQRVLIDHARARLRQKRGGKLKQVPLTPDLRISREDPDTVLSVHEALQQLERLNSRQARIVELRFFGGLSNQEVADTLGVSLRTVEGDWALAREWLKRALGNDTN